MIVEKELRFDCEKEQHEIILAYQLIDELNIKVIAERWQSKYNAIVSYDHKPFCINGFIYVLYIQCREEISNYFNYLWNRRLEDIAWLEECYKQNSSVNTTLVEMANKCVMDKEH